MNLPDYLENIKIEKSPPPTDSANEALPLKDMNPLVFERLCCELVESRCLLEEHDKVLKVYPIGESGQKQGGADIFVKEVQADRISYSLYEVKRVKNYNIGYYKETVERFLACYNDWEFKPESFFVFTAEELDHEKLVEYEKLACSLSDRNIKYEIVTPSRINRWLRKSPKIVYKFFHKAWVELLFGVRGLWHMENFGYFNFRESPGWENFEGEEEYSTDELFFHKNSHIKIKAFLPTYERNSASCLVSLRNGRFSHVMITLSHEDLLKTYFCAVGAPIDSNQRKFITKNVDEESRYEQYMVDIGNCRIFLNESETEALCKAIDRFYLCYINKVRKIENLWKSNRFKTIRGMGELIPLMQIKRGLWAKLLIFARENDTYNTDGEWSLFDAPGMANQLTIWTNKKTDRFERGLHANIIPTRYQGSFSSYTLSDNEVVLALRIPSSTMVENYEEMVNPRHIWDAQTACIWLKDELIPEVVRQDYYRNNQNRKRSIVENFFYGNKESAWEYVSDDYCRSYYLEAADLKLNDSVSYSDLEESVITLQSFYYGASGNLFIQKVKMQKLYAAVHLALKQAKMPCYSYLQGNLSYLNAGNMVHLLERLQDYAAGECKDCTSDFLIDCALRCIQVSLRDEECNLNCFECKSMLENLWPFVEHMQDVRLINRQIERIGTW